MSINPGCQTIDFTDFDLFENPIYRPFIEDFRRYQIYKGGAGAGKSVSISDKIIYCMCNYEGFNVLVIRKTGRDNHDSTFSELQKSINRMGLSEYFSINRSRGAEEITCLIKNTKAVFRGLDDIEQIKSVTFATGDLVCIWWEEASEGSEEEFNQLDTRLRGAGLVPKHIILSFNPIDVDCWIKRRFFDFPMNPEDGFILQTTYKDNEYLDEKYKQILENYKNIDENHYRVYVLNEWGSRTTASVFHNIKVHDFDIPEYQFQNIRYGQDYGWNHANACVGIGYKDGELYIWWEQFAKYQFNKDFILAVKESGKVQDLIVKGDSAEPDKIAEWNAAGYNVYGAVKGPDSLRFGVEYLKSLPAIHIHKTLCPNAAREFLAFKYRETKDGRISDKEFVELNDDCIAAVRYATEEFHSRESNFTGLMQRTDW